jgi:hypothetical protein
MPLTDEQYLLLYIAVMAACFALCVISTFHSIGFLMERRAKLQIICLACCCCGAINTGMLLFLTIFPPGYCWWIPVGSIFYQWSLISTTFLMVFRANAVLTMVSIASRRLFWVLSGIMIAAQIAMGLAVCITSKYAMLANNACSPLLPPGLMTGWYGTIILGAVALTSVFSFQLVKARQHHKDSFLHIIFISSAASAIVAGISQITFSMLLVFNAIPPKYSMILVKSDMTINVLITVSFVKRLMQETAQYSSRGTVQREFPVVKDFERRLESAELGTSSIQLTSASHRSDWVPEY